MKLPLPSGGQAAFFHTEIRLASRLAPVCALLTPASEGFFAGMPEPGRMPPRFNGRRDKNCMSYSHLNPAAAPTDRDILTTLQRWLELSFDAPMIVLFGFFAYHQWANTGFLTPKFGPFEMLCLYGPIVVALVAPAVRAWSGRRDPARPWDVVMKLSLAAGSLWLLTVFPFDFSHLADILPGPIRFLISWITDDIGRIIMVVQVVLGLITAITTTARYFSPRE